MLVNTPGNYLPVLDQFLAHWAQVNAQVGPRRSYSKAGSRALRLRPDGKELGETRPGEL